MLFCPIGHVGKNTCKTCKPDFTQTFDLLLTTSIFCMLPEHLQDWK